MSNKTTQINVSVLSSKPLAPVVPLPETTKAILTGYIQTGTWPKMRGSSEDAPALNALRIEELEAEGFELDTEALKQFMRVAAVAHIRGQIDAFKTKLEDARRLTADRERSARIRAERDAAYRKRHTSKDDTALEKRIAEMEAQQAAMAEKLEQARAEIAADEEAMKAEGVQGTVVLDLDETSANNA